ncbi:ResB-like family cytochrome c biogenesis protein [Citrifermentans bemidjiense Bem]|uniref:ResB-like family cytochrome c biogenesis protein n=1 Tax=Citrifermentans bemidjiense (strain ATCC BAA-1014 / DSM 16622 / JCM 12645 / Bem) TaxID=404380 RepID=B5EHG9_CITBB|nr:hypothetical protein [Citrifermentans bemidjiense]ACH38179.1 ResB-like family cytochrome c biogenesis protein [Citrifermentans bemidjiense Bem]
MNEINTPTESEAELYPIQPRFHPIHKIPRLIYDFLASAKLAMFLLVAILLCCLVGVTVFRGQRAWDIIFSTLWFNGLLVLLVLNVACCFFGRIWHRRLTLITFGMIMFHLSFVAMFCGVVYNSLYFFEGTMRLTEGETLQNGAAESWEGARFGRFFSPAEIRGETTLIKMHRGYKVGKDDKRAAYEIEVGAPKAKKRDIIYATRNLDCDGFKYLTDREGYSALVVLADRQGRELYGAYLPLQSLKQEDGSYIYSTGTSSAKGSLPFPQGQQKPLYNLQVGFRPFPDQERLGEAFFQLWPYSATAGHQTENPAVVGSAYVGRSMPAGDYGVSVKEMRYWVGMKVRRDPGKPVILGSLWVGLAGMVLTTIGRIRKGSTGVKTA